MMRKLFALLLSLTCIWGLSGCTGSPGDSDTPPKENDAPEAQTALPEVMTSGKIVRISGGFEALVRHKIPSYLEDDSVPEAAVVTRFQDGPIILNLGPELAGQIEEDSWYYFTIEDKEFELNVDPEHPERFVWGVFDQGMDLRIRSVTPCEPTGIDGEHLEFSMD